MGYEEQPRSRLAVSTEPAIVECSHNGLSGSGGCHDKVAVLVEDTTTQGEGIEDALLMRLGQQVQLLISVCELPVEIIEGAAARLLAESVGGVPLGLD